MKKILAVAAVTVAAACVALTASGCGSPAKNLASLASNWYYDSGFKRIQNTFTEGNENFAPEKLTYSVKHTGTQLNPSYTVSYGEGGVYTTEFYAKRIDAQALAAITAEEWRADYLNALGSDGTMVLYRYAVSLNIPSVTYRIKVTGEEKTFGAQTRTVENYFMDVANRLCPVYSKQIVDNVIPANMQAGTLEYACSEVKRTYESFYSLYGDNVRTDITDNSSGDKSAYSVSGLNGSLYSVFDVGYVDVLARAMQNMTSSLNQTVCIYTPGLPVREYNLKGEAKALDGDKTKADGELAAVQTLFEAKGLFTGGTVTKEDGTTENKTLPTIAVNVAFNGGSFSGVTQSYWFAAASDGKNSARTIMVKLSTPLTYNLGSLEYLLTSIDSLPNL